ncbi:MAG: serine kinase [Bacteroidetes bacterium]|jgi:predicted transcriptional regulator|nr:serine kinase [Bacteroidota bacterium]
MKVKDLTTQLKMQVKAGSDALSNEITGGYTSDLLSDVMGNAQEGHVWITMQAHKNIIAVASLKELAAIIVIGNHTPGEDTIAQANQEGIPLLSTPESAFDVSGKIYNMLHE